MIQSEHGKKKVSTFHTGADADVSPEFAELREGHYIDAKNMAIRTDNGWDYALQKIKGEELLYSTPTTYTYKCTGSCFVNHRLVNIWVSTDGGESQIEIEGTIMMSVDNAIVKWDVNYPFQIDTNDSCNGGEFAITDFLNFPLVFAVQDMIESYNSTDPLVQQKYFSLFNIDLFVTNLTLPQGIPVFTDLYLVGGSSGLPSGQYSYSIRYADSTGNKTAWSCPTPLIPVPLRIISPTAGKYNTTMGGGNGSTASTPYGIRLKIRVTNVANYEYIEIRRVAHNSGQALNYAPTPQKLMLVKDFHDAIVDITTVAYQNAIIEWMDSDLIASEWGDMTDEEDTIAPSSFNAAKAVRYYQDRLVYMNIKYPSQDITETGEVIFRTFDGTNNLGGSIPAVPTTDFMGKAGHYDAWNQVYRKKLQTGEKYGWGLFVSDEKGGRSFTVPIPDLEDYQMPNRRDSLDDITDPVRVFSKEWSVTKGTGACHATDVYNNEGAHTYEVFDLVDAVRKNAATADIGIRSSGGNTYAPLTPVSSVDTSHYGNDTQLTILAGISNKRFVSVSNNGFQPNYYSLGMTFAGVEKLPDWAKSFSIVRTERAGRVVAQGIGVYNLRAFGNSSAGKDSNTFVCHFPDIDNAYTNLTIADIQNSGQFKIQFVSPLGFFTEPYSCDIETSIIPIITRRDRKIDMISYARVLYEDGSVNHGLDSIAKGVDNPYWTNFGVWRNDPADVTAGVFDISGVGGNNLFDITSITDATEGRGKIVTLKVNANIYKWTTNLGKRTDADSIDAMNFHEPFYIVNIIDGGKISPNGNIVEYNETGHYQKLKSIIGLGINADVSYELVDERWEDCIPNYNDKSTHVPSGNPNIEMLDSYVYVLDKITGIETKWLNVTYKTAGTVTTILDALQLSGSYTFTDYNNNSLTIHGVYKSTITTSSTTATKYTLNFNYFNQSYDAKYFNPTQDAEIYVKYDKYAPIRVFGGDVTVGECVFAPFDRMGDENSSIDTQFEFLNPLPYPYYVFDSYYKQLENAKAPNTQDPRLMYMDCIRQWIIMFACESRTNLCYQFAIDNTLTTYNDSLSFPLISYVQRPFKWDAGDLTKNYADNGGAIDVYYKDRDFLGEETSWAYGGFKFNQLSNIDYAKEQSDGINFSKPIVGFKENTHFCTQVIWSKKRAINEQNDPNIKTFLSTNIYDISDAMQEIKYAYDDNTSKGNNLYAVTGLGTCLLITDKKILSDITGNQLAYIDPTDGSFITDQYWLSKVVGMNDEMWRSAAEFNNQLWFANNESVWQLSGLEIKDILRDNKGSYYTKIYPYLKNTKSGYTSPVCATYDRNHEEYWLCFGEAMTDVFFAYVALLDMAVLDLDQYSPNSYLVAVDEFISLTTDSIVNNIVYLPNTRFSNGQTFYIKNDSGIILYLNGANNTNYALGVGLSIKLVRNTTTAFGWTITTKQSNGVTFMYNNSPEKTVWTGFNTHEFEKMTCVTKVGLLNDLRVIGMKNKKTYKTDSSYLINGLPIESYVDMAISPALGYTKEPIDVLINSKVKPTSVEFAEELANLPECTVLPVSMRDYRGNYWMQVPRKAVAPQNRLQNDVIFIRINHDTAEDFWVISNVTNYKLLK